MLSKEHVERVAEHVWEIPKTFRDDMRVPARLYADEDLLDAALLDNSVVQLVNTATLPGVVRYAIAMPDIHQGYGFPIGGVVATLLPEGVISPGGVGYDINCGVRLLVSLASVEEVKPYLEDIASRLYANCPSGVGSHGQLRLSNTELDQVLHEVRAGWWGKDIPRVTTWIVPKNSVESRVPILHSSLTEPANADETSSGPWVPETISSRWTELLTSTMSPLLHVSAFTQAISRCRFTAVLVASATRFAKTTLADFRKLRATTASNCQTANWFVHHSIRTMARSTSAPWHALLTSLTPTGNCWRI